MLKGVIKMANKKYIILSIVSIVTYALIPSVLFLGVGFVFLILYIYEKNSSKKVQGEANGNKHSNGNKHYRNSFKINESDDEFMEELTRQQQRQFMEEQRFFMEQMDTEQQSFMGEMMRQDQEDMRRQQQEDLQMLDNFTMNHSMHDLDHNFSDGFY